MCWPSMMRRSSVLNSPTGFVRKRSHVRTKWLGYVGGPHTTPSSSSSVSSRVGRMSGLGGTLPMVFGNA